MTESFARERTVSYAWNSTREHGLSWEGHLLLKQGLKIGYLRPSRFNRK